MAILPEHPDLEQLRRQAKELLRAGRASDRGSLRRLSAVSAPVTLAGAQLAVAREFGQSSWSALVHEVQARNATLDENVVRFLSFSVNAQIGRAARMLAETPALAEAGFPVAVVLGDADGVTAELRRDPGVATRADVRTGWTALHLACASRFHLDPVRAPGLAAVTRLLLDAGAAIESETSGGHCWRPLECAVTSANSSPHNEPNHPGAAGPRSAGAARDPGRGAVCRRRHLVPSSCSPTRANEPGAVRGGIGRSGRNGQHGSGEGSPGRRG